MIIEAAKQITCRLNYSKTTTFEIRSRISPSFFGIHPKLESPTKRIFYGCSFEYELSVNSRSRPKIEDFEFSSKRNLWVSGNRNDHILIGIDETIWPQKVLRLIRFWKEGIVVGNESYREIHKLNRLFDWADLEDLGYHKNKTSLIMDWNVGI
jgi:hypothetical protein